MRSATTSAEPSLADPQRSGPPLDPLLDIAPAGFLTIDDAGVVRRANATIARLVGRPREEIEGHHIDLLLSAAGRIFYSTHLFPLLRLHGHADELYVPLATADGSDLPVLINGVRRDAEPDGEARYDLVVVPMRERNRLEDELIAARNAAQAAAAAKDRFLSVVSHELRSPLTGVAGFSDLLLREHAGPLTEKQRHYVERIRDAASYQVGLIEDILDFAAIDGERRGLEPMAVAVEELVARAESILGVRAAEDGHTIERRPVPAPGMVVADPRAVQQILLNLGVNAIKYSPAERAIELVVEHVDRRVHLSILDHGGGIAADELERIFEPFVRLEAATSAGRKGVGLGLAISRDLARAMGGDIIVSSVIGEGSTFTLELPAA